jgi:NADH dehydrogenase
MYETTSQEPQPLKDAAKRRRVVVLGAGFGGLRAATALASDPRVDVTLIDRSERPADKTRLHELGRNVAPRSLHHFFRHSTVQVITADVVSIDADRQTVVTEDGHVTYERLVFALGGQTTGSGVTGVTGHCVTLDGVADAARFARLIAVLKDSGERLVVVGGGATGVEASAQASAVLGADRVVLLEYGSDLLPSIGGFGSGYASFMLRRLGVRVRPRSRVVEVQSDAVVLAGGERVSCGGTLWCAGVGPSPLRPSSHQGAGPRVPLLDGRLRSLQHPNVYFVGDSALGGSSAADHPSAQVAALQGDYVGADILAELDGREPECFSGQSVGEFTSLGPFDAVGWFSLAGFEIPMVGFPAWCLKGVGGLRHSLVLHARRVPLAFQSGRRKAGLERSRSERQHGAVAPSVERAVA